MTYRHSGYLVVLGHDIREDDAKESVLNAIRMIGGVAQVSPVPAEPAASVIAARRDLRWREALLRLAEEVTGDR